MSNTFEILMNQLDMPLEMRSSSAFLHAEIQEVVAVSYTHLDVYKRQPHWRLPWKTSRDGPS